MKHILIILSIFIFIINLSFAQYTNVMISNVQAPNEPSIMINPKNTNQVVAGANIRSYYYSTDGGHTWTREVLSSSLYGVWGDPCIIVDTAESFYYFHLSNPSSGGHWIDRIVCQKSTNGGMTWNNPGTYTYYNPSKDQDKEWACVDRNNNYIYVTWTQFDDYGSSSQLDSSNILFARSTNGSNTWDNVQRIDKLGGDCVDDDNTVEGAVPCVGPNGEVYVSWSGPKIRNTQFGIFFDKSTDKGQTWLNDDIYITDQPGGWAFNIPGIFRCNGFPITVCDLSGGPFHGHIYINWSDQRNGTNDTDVWLIKSTNGGQTWGAIKRVNDDPPGKQQFFTWMDIDQTTGYLYFVFYDRRNYSDWKTDVYIARSTDGGETFDNIKISSTPFLPTGQYFFGDYNNISAHDNKVRPIWTRMDNTLKSVWTAIIDTITGIQTISSEIPAQFKLSQNFPNPFNPLTKIGFDIPSNNGRGVDVKLFIYDITGREVVRLVDGSLNPGSYEVEWNASGYTSGVYVYKFIAGDFSETRKMIMIK